MGIQFRYLGAARAYAVGVMYHSCPCTWPHDTMAREADDCSLCADIPLSYQRIAEEDPGPTHIPECPYKDPNHFEGF